MIDIEAHQSATRSLSTLLSKGDTQHTESFYFGLARRLVANAGLVKGYLDAVVEGDRTVLQQQRTLELDDPAWWDEHCGHLKRELDDALATRERVKAKHLPEHDPDARAQDREDDRSRERRQDEAANRQAVRP